MPHVSRDLNRLASRSVAVVVTPAHERILAASRHLRAWFARVSTDDHPGVDNRDALAAQKRKRLS